MLGDLAAIATALGTAVRKVVGNDKQIEIRRDRSRKRIKEEVEATDRWANEISLPGIKRLRIDRAFVDLDLNLTARRRRSQGDDRTQKVSQLLQTLDNVLLVGDPGAGKTTSLKFMARQYLQGKHILEPRLPVLVEMRELRGDESLSHHIPAKLGFEVLLSKKFEVTRERVRDVVMRAASAALTEMKSVVFLDGLDEVPGNRFRETADEIGNLLRYADGARFIITCRSAAASSLRWQFVTQREIAPLSDNQVLSVAEGVVGKSAARGFLQRIKEQPYYGVEIRPLTLVHLLTLQDRAGAIPRRPIDVYSHIVELYVKDWDDEKRVSRSVLFSQLDRLRLGDFLDSLAYELTVKDALLTFSHDLLEEIYRSQLAAEFELPESESQAVARDVENLTGLVLELGLGNFRWAHLTIQEFLAARYLVRTPWRSISGPHFWQLPEQLALATARGSRSSESIIELAREVYRRTAAGYEYTAYPAMFLSRYIGRLTVEQVTPRPGIELGLAYLSLYWQMVPEDANHTPEEKRNLIQAWGQLVKRNGDLARSIEDFIARFSRSSGTSNDLELDLLEAAEMSGSLHDFANFLTSHGIADWKIPIRLRKLVREAID